MVFFLKILSFEDLVSFFSSNKEKSFLFTFHSMGDRDAVGSAAAFSRYFKNARLGTPDFITSNARRMLKEVSYESKIEIASLSNVEIVVVFDANNIEALDKFGLELLSFKGEVLFIDHHLPVNEQLGNNFLLFSDESYNSTASIIYDLMKRLGFKADKEASILLLNGIISDSADFRNAFAHTFMQIGELLEIANMDYSGIMGYFHESVPIENRYSTIKDLYNSNIQIIGKYLLIYGSADEHANILADMAIKIGADASVFWMVSDKEVSISARLRPPLDKEYSIHLGRIMQNASKIINGSGGGHPCAAGAYGPKKENAEKIANYIIEEIRKALGRK